MNFDFSDDQKLLKEQVRKFLADKCPTKTVRRVLDGNETHADEVWKGLIELGVTGMSESDVAEVQAWVDERWIHYLGRASA